MKRNEVSPGLLEEIVDAFNKRYGVRPGFRANHANAESFKRRHALKHNHEPPT